MSYPEPEGIVGPDGSLPARRPPAPPPQQPAVRDMGFGTGAMINLHLLPDMSGYRPAWTVDGRTELAEWGTFRFPVAPGVHRVGGGFAASSAKSAAMTVTVNPGQTVDVYYRPGTFGGRIGHTPQRGSGCAMAALIAMVVILPLLILLLLMVVLVAV